MRGKDRTPVIRDAGRNRAMDRTPVIRDAGRNRAMDTGYFALVRALEKCLRFRMLNVWKKPKFYGI